MKYKIRHAVQQDKAVIMDIYAYARKFMAEHGNPNQWKNNNPSEETIDNDILSGQLYVIYESGDEEAVNGVLSLAVGFCEKQIKHLRIDTHKDNTIMQHVIEKNGFTKCGTIYVKDGSPRIAYEKVL